MYLGKGDICIALSRFVLAHACKVNIRASLPVCVSSTHALRVMRVHAGFFYKLYEKFGTILTWCYTESYIMQRPRPHEPVIH